MAHALVEVPELSVRLAHGREHARGSIDVFFIVADGGELSGVKITDTAGKSAMQIAGSWTPARRRSGSASTSSWAGRRR